MQHLNNENDYSLCITVLKFIDDYLGIFEKQCNFENSLN